MITKEKMYESALHTFENEANAVRALADTVDRKQLCDAIELLATTKGHIIATGCGTSGVAANKIAQVFNCVDRAALYLNPADAPHGDYGVIRPGDVVIVITKSGKTREMAELIPIAHLRGAKVLCVTENRDSEVYKNSDYQILLNTGLEACPYQCLSTTSVTAVFALFDAISIAIMLYNGIDTEYFKMVHPGGGVGEMLKSKGK
ncbi:MAG: SIS domain-containing protein [Oscillospiraceae bacterium]|nr:SIS domain-containing protein [Oscillospiraceae bacterium]